MIADAQFVLTAQAIEDGEADAQQRNAEPLGGLAAMAVRDEQVGALGERLEVAEIADLDRIAGDVFEDFRAACRRHRGVDLGAQAKEEGRQRIEKIRLGGDGDPLAREVEVAVEQGVLQLRPPPANPFRRRSAREFAEQSDEAVDRLQTAELAKQRVIDPGQFGSRAAGARMCSPIAIVRRASPSVRMSSIEVPP